MSLTAVTDQAAWDKQVTAHGGHPLQCWSWGVVKQNTGHWTAHRLASADGLAQVLVRRLPRPFRAMAYVPRGPIILRTTNRQKFLQALADWAKQQGCIELKIEPEWPISTALPAGFRRSAGHILLQRTVSIDLSQTADEILAAMKPDVRKNMRRAERAGVTVRQATGADFAAMMQIYRDIAERNHFALHADDYYRDIIKQFGGDCRLWLAEAAGRPVAFQFAVSSPSTTFELYGGANSEGNRLRANYLLQHQVIMDEKSRGIARLDMNGLLEGNVSEFKRRFVLEATEFVPTLDASLSSLAVVYERLLPLGKRLGRRLKR
jgi:lipid II:glycine glycyltransferase (peptidoglycan interpeptide bridge formation enzyme)